MAQLKGQAYEVATPGDINKDRQATRQLNDVQLNVSRYTKAANEALKTEPTKEKKPADRPQSAREMLNDLEAVVAPTGETISSGKIPVLPAASKASERRGLYMAIVGAILLLLLASSSWYWYKSKQPVPAETPSRTR